jgi:hypothetical protein
LTPETLSGLSRDSFSPTLGVFRIGFPKPFKLGKGLIVGVGLYALGLGLVLPRINNKGIKGE